MSHLIQNVLLLTSAVALLAFSALHGCSGLGHSPSIPPSPRSATTYYLDCSTSQRRQRDTGFAVEFLGEGKCIHFPPGRSSPAQPRHGLQRSLTLKAPVRRTPPS